MGPPHAASRETASRSSFASITQGFQLARDALQSKRQIKKARSERAWDEIDQ